MLSGFTSSLGGSFWVVEGMRFLVTSALDSGIVSIDQFLRGGMAGFFGTDYSTWQPVMMQTSASDEEIADQVQMLFLPRNSVQRFAAPKAYQAPLCSQQASASSSTTNNEARYSNSHRLIGITEAEEIYLASLGIDMNPTVRERDCGLCTRRRPLTDLISTKDCAHKYCTECCKRHAEEKVSSGSLQIECPHPNCSREFDIVQCGTLLSDVSFRTLCLRQRGATSFWRRVHCPSPDCFAFIPPGFISGTTDTSLIDTFVECYSCHRGFCLECKVPWERECGICAEMRPHKEFISTQDCGHKYCTECCKRHAEVKILSGSLQIECLHPDCSHTFDFQQCSTLLSEANFDILNIRLTEAAIPASEKVFCPFQDCSTMMLKSESSSSATDTFAECYSCHRGFCLKCNIPWHANKTCREYRADIENSKQSGDQKLRDLAKQMKWKECPNQNCRLTVELKSGCNHITCRCKHEFCYICLKPWINKKSTCKCKLWDEARIITN